MKKFLLILILSLFSLSAHCRVLDPLSRIEAAKQSLVKSRDDSENKYRSMIIEYDSPKALDSLRSQGVIIYNTRDNMALACVPEHLISDLESWPSLMRASLSRTRSLTLDIARMATGVEEVHSGLNLPRTFTGKGIIVGLSDVGFDPGHIAFKDRVIGVSHFNDIIASSINLSSENELEAWQTDDYSETHATHVAGIMAGGDLSSPYHGVAPDADIFATTSILHDVGILAGVEKIISYAKANQRPAVINLSLGSKIGPHDGTDLFCRYLDQCAKDNVAILVAAGNDGAMNVSATKTLSAEDAKLSTRLRSTHWDDVTIYKANIDAWSSDRRPMKLRFRTWDKTLERYTFETEWFEFKNFSTDTIWQISDENNPEFAKLYEGSIMAAAELGNNYRYNISISVSLHSKVYLPDHHWSNHSLIIDFGGEEGATVNAFIEGECEFTYVQSGESVPPSPDFSISSMACGHNTICVGSATTRTTTPLISGGDINWSNLTQGTMSGFSSYGTLDDGRRLPHICAPGAMIVSALNRHYYIANPSISNRIAAESPAQPGHYYFAESGTSMATPHATGILALWLEADPTLTGNELRDIAIDTASPDGIDASNPRAGAGMIDAMAGLRRIFGIQGTIAPEIAESLIEVGRHDGQLIVKGADGADIKVYDISGRRLSPEALPAGPVIVKITHDNGVVTTKKLL